MGRLAPHRADMPRHEGDVQLILRRAITACDATTALKRMRGATEGGPARRREMGNGLAICPQHRQAFSEREVIDISERR